MKAERVVGKAALLVAIISLFGISGRAAGTETRIAVESPAAGSTVSKTVTITVRAGSGVAQTKLYIDGNFLVSTPPFSIQWDSTSVNDGNHTILVRAFDSGGMVIASDSVSVNVANGWAGVPPPVGGQYVTRTKGNLGRIFVIVEENHGYKQVVGNTAEMPYLNRLIARGGLATQYYANAHPSLPNYLWLTIGGNDGFSTDTCSGTVSGDNIARELNTAGLSWKVYAESLPYIGYLGCSSGEYVKKHNPFAYFSDVQTSSTQQQNIVPFSQFAPDLASRHLPKFSFIVPNLLDDAHDGSLTAADDWLHTNIRPLLRTGRFQPGGRAMLIIVFDEGSGSAYGGGRVAWVVISPKVKPGYRSWKFYQHPSTLRLILRGFGVQSLPGAAATAPGMGEFFKHW